MKTEQEILGLEICECGEKSVAQAIDIFINTDLPFKKSKKLVTQCNKNCCRPALQKLYDMVYFGKYDYQEIDRQIQMRLDRTKRMIEALKSDG